MLLEKKAAFLQVGPSLKLRDLKQRNALKSLSQKMDTVLA